MIIAVDVDNVVNNLTEVVLNQYNEDSGDSLQMSDLMTYNIEPYVKEAFKGSIEGYFSSCALNASVVPYSMQMLEKIAERHTVYFVTSTRSDVIGKKAIWLQFYFPFVPKSRIVMLQDKCLFRCDAIIDDDLSNVVASHASKKLLFDYPWNRTPEGTDEKYGIQRVKDWRDIYHAIMD